VRQSFGDDSFHFLPVARSKDLVNWEYVGDVFTASTFPEWLPGTPGENTFLWAPDIRYLDGKYYLYYSVAHFGSSDSDSLFTVAVATAPTPTGPWTDSGGSVIEGETCPPTTNIDPRRRPQTHGRRRIFACHRVRRGRPDWSPHTAVPRTTQSPGLMPGRSRW
jgi:glycosyl hydrolase family 43